MRTIKYLVIAVHIIAVVSVMAFTLISDHSVIGKGFYKCEQYGNSYYLTEDAGSFSVLYRGDDLGVVSAVYKSNMDESRVTIEDFYIADDVFILENNSLGYAIKRISAEDFTGISKTNTFVLKDIESISDFYVSLNDQMVYITTISNGRMGANVHAYALSEFISVGSAESDAQTEEAPPELPARYRYEAENGRINTAYFDGTNIITDIPRVKENTRDPRSYASSLYLTIGQSLNVNSFVLLVFLAYAIIGVIIITLIVRLVEKRRRFIDLILVNEIFILAAMALGVYLFGNMPLAVIWAAIVSIVNIIVILVENRDIRALCENMKHIVSGNLHLEKPSGNSIETSVLWRGMNEVKYLYEEYKYFHDTSTAAALRFLPHNIGAMFKCNSLDEIRPGDSISLDGTFMMLRTKKEISNSLIRMTEDYEKRAEGTLLTGECSASEIRMLFSKPGVEPAELGLRFFSEIGDDSACALYFKDSFKISIVGTPTKSILNIGSHKMEKMERMGEWFFDMGIRMVISEEVKESNRSIKSPLRFIGYCYIEGEKKLLYEVINVYGEKIRSDRLRCLEDFDKALHLLYQKDFYLARTAFTEILKADPGDELTRWYVFVCEKYLNNPELTDDACALDPRN